MEYEWNNVGKTMPTIQITRNRYKLFPVGGKNDIVRTVRKRTNWTNRNRFLSFWQLVETIDLNETSRVQSLKELLTSSSIFEKLASLNSGLKKHRNGTCQMISTNIVSPWGYSTCRELENHPFLRIVNHHDYLWISLYMIIYEYHYNHPLMIVSWLYKI